MASATPRLAEAGTQGGRQREGEHGAHSERRTPPRVSAAPDGAPADPTFRAEPVGVARDRHASGEQTPHDERLRNVAETGDGGHAHPEVVVLGDGQPLVVTAKGLEDGPEYSPDGQYIYFNSERTGHMQIWRMKADGSQQEQVFSDDYNNWFPHISPDGKWMVFLTYERDVIGHPENKNVMLRLMSLQDADKKIKVLANLFGGQGTINVPSWSPDSKQVAFVSYALIVSDDVHTDSH